MLWLRSNLNVRFRSSCGGIGLVEESEKIVLRERRAQLGARVGERGHKRRLWDFSTGHQMHLDVSGARPGDLRESLAIVSRKPLIERFEIHERSPVVSRPTNVIPPGYIFASESIPDGVLYPSGSKPSNSGMDIHDIRLANLRLIATRAGGRPKLAQRLGMSYQLLQNYIGKTPTKRIGEKTARKVEATFALPHGWMDQLQEGTTAETTLDLIAERESIFDRAEEIVQDNLRDPEPLDIGERKKNAWVIDTPERPKISGARPATFHGLDQLTIDLLPQELRRYAHQPIRSGGFEAEADFLSDKLVVELKSASSTHSIDSGLLQLATIRSMLPPVPPRHFVLILIEDRGERPRLQQAMIRGGILGVDVYIARNPHEACTIIETLERDPSRGYGKETSR